MDSLTGFGILGFLEKLIREKEVLPIANYRVSFWEVILLLGLMIFCIESKGTFFFAYFMGFSIESNQDQTQLTN